MIKQHLDPFPILELNRVASQVTLAKVFMGLSVIAMSFRETVVCLLHRGGSGKSRKET